MSTEPHAATTGREPPAAVPGSSHPLTDAEAEERADVEEDRRRQRELDDTELGGEA